MEDDEAHGFASEPDKNQPRIKEPSDELRHTLFLCWPYGPHIIPILLQKSHQSLIDLIVDRTFSMWGFMAAFSRPSRIRSWVTPLLSHERVRCRCLAASDEGSKCRFCTSRVAAHGPRLWMAHRRCCCRKGLWRTKPESYAHRSQRPPGHTRRRC